MPKKAEVYWYDGHKQELVPWSEVPEDVKKLLRRKDINYVEVGFCPDLSVVRGYWIEDDTITQKTGSSWKFYPMEAYATVPLLEDLEEFQENKEVQEL